MDGHILKNNKMPVSNPRPTKTVRFSDTAGVDGVTYYDSQGAPVYRVDSTGLRHTKKGTQRIK